MRAIKVISLIVVLSFTSRNIYAQCCAAGSGSPIGGGASQGVLLDRQFEVNANVQYISSALFFTGDERDDKFLDNFNSTYLYSRFAYGVSPNLTMSIESGYFFNKTQVGLNAADTISSSGISDLILFPRYRIINKGGFANQFEWTVGLGFKIPLGSFNDSTSFVEPFSGSTYYVTKPLAVQLSSGSQDLIFYTFLFKSLTPRFRVFANALYVMKGWNPAGEKFGDYAGVGLFASRSITQNISATAQIKGEWVGSMKLNPNILMYAYPDYDYEATGSKKLFFVPQLTYVHKKAFTFYLLTEIPLYQHLNKTQIGSQYQFTFGLSYRFFAKEQQVATEAEEATGNL